MASLAKLNKTLEKFWWVATILTLILIIVLCFIDGFNQWVFFFFVPVLTSIMALIRRFMGNRLEKSEQEKAAQQKSKKK